LIAEDERVSFFERDGEDCGADGAGRLEDPLEAPCVRAQGMNRAAGAADEDLATEDGWLGEGGNIALEPEGPFEGEARDLIEGQTGGLEAGVVRGWAPAIPN